MLLHRTGWGILWLSGYSALSSMHLHKNRHQYRKQKTDLPEAVGKHAKAVAERTILLQWLPNVHLAVLFARNMAAAGKPLAFIEPCMGGIIIFQHYRIHRIFAMRIQSTQSTWPIIWSKRYSL